MKKGIIMLLMFISTPIMSGYNVLPRIIYIPKAHLIEMVRREADVVIPDTMEYYHIWLIYETASRLDIPVRIAYRMFMRESAFNPDAEHPTSKAMGYGQILPSTWLYMLEINGLPLDLEMTPERNIVICLMYYNYLRGRWTLRGLNEDMMHEYVLASYNAGIGNVLAYGGVPPFKETKDYLQFINQ